VAGPIIFVLTYPPDLENGRINAVRATWLDTWCDMIAYRFAFDNTHIATRGDELVLDAPTGLLNTPFKTQRAAQWALKHGYDHAFFVPTDCYVAVPLLLASGYGDHDYTGFHSYDEHHIGGGSGYWLSRSALQAVATYVPYPDYEDRWVGSACRDGGIPAVHDARYHSWDHAKPSRPPVTKHLSRDTGIYDPMWMMFVHETFLATGDLT
jgi:hypothetical protein